MLRDRRLACSSSPPVHAMAGLVQHLRENWKTLLGLSVSASLTTAFHNELIAPRDILLLVATYQCWRAWAP